jgi:hypothetical protein
MRLTSASPSPLPSVLRAFEPGRAMGFGTRQIGTPATAPPDGSWTFVVRPIDATSSRLLFRGRAAGGLRSFAAVFSVGVFEPVHFAMERRTMEGIKTLAEGGKPSRIGDAVLVALWAALFVAFVSSAALVLAGRGVGEHLATFTAAGLLFQLLTLVQPSPVLSLALTILAARPGLLLGTLRDYQGRP